jgi:hypothetical protein
MADPIRVQYLPLGGNVNGMKIRPKHWLLMYPQSQWTVMTEAEYRAAIAPKRVKRKKVSHKPTPDPYIDRSRG